MPTLIFSLLIVLLLVHVNTSCAFLYLPYYNYNRHIILYAATGENDNHEAESDKTLFSLPAIGESSYDANKSSNDHITVQPGVNKHGITVSNENVSVVSKKFQIQYTCKVCDTRNSHSVTRLAYRKGVVIAQCKGCYSRHLLADNLG